MSSELNQEQHDAVEAVLSGEPSIDTLGSPEELHQLAWNWNWDDGVEIPLQIIRHPLCDRGTALLVYWTAGPRRYCQYADRDEVLRKANWSLNGYDLNKEIEKRYLAGGYTRAEIAFDPTDDDRHDWTAEYKSEESEQTIPEAMEAPVTGRVLVRARF